MRERSSRPLSVLLAPPATPTCSGTLTSFATLAKILLPLSIFWVTKARTTLLQALVATKWLLGKIDQTKTLTSSCHAYGLFLSMLLEFSRERKLRVSIGSERELKEAMEWILSCCVRHKMCNSLGDR